MSEDPTTLEEFISALISVGEGGSLAAIICGLLYVIVRTIKRNGCTCRLTTCKGQELMVMDCEEGAPAPRHRAPPNPTNEVREGIEEVSVKVEESKISSK